MSGEEKKVVSGRVLDPIEEEEQQDDLKNTSTVGKLVSSPSSSHRVLSAYSKSKDNGDASHDTEESNGQNDDNAIMVKVEAQEQKILELIGILLAYDSSKSVGLSLRLKGGNLKEQKGARTKINWDQFYNIFISFDDEIKETILMKYPVQDESTRAESTILDMALKRYPPSKIIELFCLVSPTYKKSKQIKQLMSTEWSGFRGDKWTKVCNMLGAAKTESNIDHNAICLIRHGWHEETLLHTALKRVAPLRILKNILKMAPEAVHSRNVHRHFPLVYAFDYSGQPDVIKLLLPTAKDAYIVKDTHNRTLLEWSLLHEQSVEVVKSIIDADETGESTTILFSTNAMPYEWAVVNGIDYSVVKALIPSNEKINFDEFEKDMVISAVDANHEVAFSFSISTYFSDLSKSIAQKPDLQKILSAQYSTMLTSALVMTEFYSKVAQIVCFRRCAWFYLYKRYGYETSGDSYIIFWNLCLVSAFLYGLLRELHQLYRSGLEWFNGWNYFDSLTLGVTFVTGFCLYTGWGDNGTVHMLVLLTLAAVWLSVIAFLKNNMLAFALLISGLIEVLKTLVSFLIASLLMLFAFAQIFSTEMIRHQECDNGQGSNSDPSDLQDFCSETSALLKVYFLMVGGVELSEGSSNTIVTLTVIFTFVYVILLFNILIAIVGNAWTAVYSNGAVYFWGNQLSFLNEAKGFNQTIALRGRYTRWICYLIPLDIFELMMSGLAEGICYIFWPGEFTGYFNSIIARMCMRTYGSFTWQFKYEWNKNANACRRFFLFIKAVFLVLFFGIFFIIWFVAGLCTCGIMWPKDLRQFLLAPKINMKSE